MVRHSFGPAAVATAIAVSTSAAACGYGEREVDAAGGAAATARPTGSAIDTHPSFLHGRLTLTDGTTYEGRLRFGGDEEAFWGDYFNGFKDGNPWVAHVATEPRWKILGLEIGEKGPGTDVSRQFMARFGDIAKIEARGRDLWVTLKSGTVVELSRYAADDFADGVRVWDPEQGVVDFDEGRIRRIEFQSPGRAGTAAPERLHGTVRTSGGDFTGFLQWDRNGSIGSDELEGRTGDAELIGVPFGTIQTIARVSLDSSRVTLFDGHEMVLSGTRDVGEGNAGIYVDDVRYGRVLIPWNAFERVDFSGVGADPGTSGPAYDDFPAGRYLTGTVTTRSGRSLTGRLVFDLDEGEVTETLDAPSRGVDYTIPFGVVASVVLDGGEEQGAGRATVILQSGEQLQLDRTGDLGAGNAGMLVFVDGLERPEYVVWSDVRRIDLDRPRAMYPPIGGGSE